MFRIVKDPIKYGSNSYTERHLNSIVSAGTATALAPTQAPQPDAAQTTTTPVQKPDVKSASASPAVSTNIWGMMSLAMNEGADSLDKINTQKRQDTEATDQDAIAKANANSASVSFNPFANR